MHKILITNLLLFLSFITMGQIYKAEKQLSPGVGNQTIEFEKNIGGVLYYVKAVNELCQFKNGIYSAFPKIPVSDSILPYDIEIFDSNIYMSGKFQNFNMSGKNYGLIYFDGTNWVPVAATLDLTLSKLAGTASYMGIMNNDNQNLHKLDTAGNFSLLKTAGFIINLTSFKKNEILYSIYPTRKIHKYNGSNHDSVAIPFGKKINYYSSIPSGDTDVYFKAEKYLFMVNKSFGITLIDSSKKDADFASLIPAGIFGNNMYFDDRFKSSRKVFNLSSKQMVNLIGLTDRSYLLVNSDKIYSDRYISNKHNLSEVVDGVVIQGSVYEDLNKNCTKNTGEKPVKKLKVSFISSAISYLSIANDTGYYQVVVAPGTYDIKLEDRYIITNYDSCGGNKTFSSGTNYTVNIPFHIPANIKDISGSILSKSGFIARRGFSNEYYIAYENFGSTTENFSFELQYPDSFTFKTSSISPASHIGRKLTFQVSNVKKFETEKITLSFELHAKKQLNSKVKFVCNILTKTGDQDSTNNTDTLEQRIVAAIDPNLKQSFPEGVVVVPVSKVKYHIHFQNEGNYYATRVTVVDTFEGNLPLTKLQMLGSKHPYTMRVEKGNVIIWEFDNINLLPKSQDEEGSKGFISFEAPLSRPLTIGETVKNRAHIYFDYEDAISTPFASVTRGKDIISVKPIINTTHKITVYPNPAINTFTINAETEPGEVSIYNMMGEKVYSKNIDKQSEEINSESWASGIYVIRFLDKGFSMKIIKI